MEKFEKEMLRKLANDVMFDLNDREISELQEEFEVYMRQMDLLNRIDTENVEEMVYPFDAPTTFIRDDEHESVLSVQDALANAPKVAANHIVVPKVVK